MTKPQAYQQIWVAFASYGDTFEGEPAGPYNTSADAWRAARDGE